MTATNEDTTTNVIPLVSMRQVNTEMAPLFTALARARAEVKAVAMDGENQQQKYRFASAQAILTESTPLLARHGLSFFPVESRYEPETGRLFREYLLAHETGLAQIVHSETPVVQTQYHSGNKSALDKAVGAAKTVDYRYALRDLLGIPQTDPHDEINQRAEDDDHRPVTGRQAERRAEPAKLQTQNQRSDQNDEQEKRKREFIDWVKKGRAELGDELCKTLGFDTNPKTMVDLEALAKKIGEAVRKKREKTREEQKQTEAKPAESKSSESNDSLGDVSFD